MEVGLMEEMSHLRVSWMNNSGVHTLLIVVLGDRYSGHVPLNFCKTSFKTLQKFHANVKAVNFFILVGLILRKVLTQHVAAPTFTIVWVCVFITLNGCKISDLIVDGRLSSTVS